MDVKSLLVTVGALLLLCLLFDSGYRYWQRRQQRLKVRLEPVVDSPEAGSGVEIVGPARILERDIESGLDASMSQAQSTHMQQPDSFAEEMFVLSELNPVEATDGRQQESVLDAQDSVLEVDDYIILHVLPCAAECFSGEVLLRSALAYGLRFGQRAIFHRHEHPSGRGEVLFSMSNAIEPGYFDLNTITDHESYGVTLFLTLPGVRRVQSWELMLDTARRLAHDLGGAVYDQQRMPLSQQLAEHLRRKVQEFERQCLMPSAGSFGA